MRLLDTVALVEDAPALNLYRGQVGTIVEEYAHGVFEVEFSDFTGRAYALETFCRDPNLWFFSMNALTKGRLLNQT